MRFLFPFLEFCFCLFINHDLVTVHNLNFLVYEHELRVLFIVSMYAYSVISVVCCFHVCWISKLRDVSCLSLDLSPFLGYFQFDQIRFASPEVSSGGGGGGGGGGGYNMRFPSQKLQNFQLNSTSF